MNMPNSIYIIQFAIPSYLALICALLLFRMYRKRDSQLDRKTLILVVLAYAVSTFGWLSLIIYITLPALYVVLNSFVLLAFMSHHVIYYHFIFKITKVYKDEKISMLHYLLPAMGFLTLFICSLFVPYHVQLSLVESRGLWVEGYTLYSALFTSKTQVLLIYNLIYAILGLYRIMYYRKIVVNYSADEQRTSFTWLYQFLFAMLALLPMTIVAFIFSKHQIISSGITIFPIFLACFKDIVLAHNLLLDNFVVINFDSIERETPALASLLDTGAIKQNDIKRLEAYMRKNKPYLKPKLKITDMTRDLCTNRTSLSMLINQTYGMNFSRYINRFRLVELEKIKSDPNNANLTELELIEKVGFSDYRGYTRVKQREETEL